MSLVDSTGIPSASVKLPQLDCSLNISVYRFGKQNIWWWKSSGSDSGLSYQVSGIINPVRLYYVTLCAACSIAIYY